VTLSFLVTSLVDFCIFYVTHGSTWFVPSIGITSPFMMMQQTTLRPFLTTYKELSNNWGDMVLLFWTVICGHYDKNASNPSGFLSQHGVIQVHISCRTKHGLVTKLRNIYLHRQTDTWTLVVVVVVVVVIVVVDVVLLLSLQLLVASHCSRQ
jgi:hypothetical protein